MVDRTAAGAVSDAPTHILIADDQVDNVLVLQEILGGLYTTHAVYDGESLLRHVEAGAPIDLILLDIVMPGLDGFEVCRKLRARPDCRDLPILFLTGLESDADEAYGLSLGAVDFIHKPISPAVVLARVGNHLALARANRLLRERNEDMERLATRAAGLGIWDYDVAGDRMSWNDEMFLLYGLSRQDVGGGFPDLFSAIHPDDAARMKRDYGLALEGERDIASEFRIVRPDGDIRVLKANATIRRNGAGAPIRLLGTNWDVTDYRRAVEEMALAKTRAEAANVAKSNFLATMSHELRTPLNAVIGFAQLLRLDETRPEVREQLDIIWRSATNLTKLIQDILDLSKVESGKLTLDCHQFTLSDELSLVAAYFQAAMREKGLEFRVGVGRDVPPHLHGDAGLLRRVLINLLGNAVKFTARGRVEMTVDRLCPRADGKVGLEFHVSDSGVGIKPENQERIFDIFEQEDNSSTRRYGGVGLGLAISKLLVTLLGGAIRLRSAPGVGSRFSFSVVMEPAAEEGAHGAETLVAPLIPASGARVLVVEDDRVDRLLMTDILARNHCQVTVAETGEAALALLTRRRFDLVLMDIQLPVVGGIEVVRRVRAGTVEHCDPGVPIIAVTAHAMRADRARFLGHGVDAYVSKPIDVDEFLGVVTTTLRDGAQLPR